MQWRLTQTSQPLPLCFTSVQFICFISCEGVLNLRMAETLARGLFPCCPGNHVLGHKMSVLVILQALSYVELEGACQCVWAVTWEWWMVSHPRWLSPLCHLAVGQRASERQLRRKLRKIHTVTETVKWDTLTAHVIVKYRLMGIVKPELLNTELLMNAL